MQLDITFKNIDPTDALKDYASKRLSKLDKYIEKPSEVHVVLSVEKRRHKADVTLSADGVVINAVEITEDMYSAIDMVMDKLERQIKKHKEKLQGKKGQAKTSSRLKKLQRLHLLLPGRGANPM
jgi:putative sigma-54 modulation protein